MATTYYIKENDKIVLFDTDKQKLENTLLFTPQYQGLEILETQDVIIEGVIMTQEEYNTYLDEKEKERVASLKVTKRVFALALQQFGITYTQLKELIATNEQAQLEWDLCVELERSNPLLDVMASQMGVTPEQLDYIFKKANGEDVNLPEQSTELEGE